MDPGMMYVRMAVAADSAEQLLDTINLPAVGGLGIGAFALAFMLYRNLRTAQIELTDKYIAENTRLRELIDMLEAEERASVETARVERQARMDAEATAHRVRLELESEVSRLNRRLSNYE